MAKSILVLSDEEITDLIINIRNHTACTYPFKIFKRRLELLTKHEQATVLSKYKKIDSLYHEIEETIANRAEIANDPWK